MTKLNKIHFQQSNKKKKFIIDRNWLNAFMILIWNFFWKKKRIKNWTERVSIEREAIESEQKMPMLDISIEYNMLF